MKSIILVCAVCLQLGENYGLENTDGVGAFAYDGPSGRYGGTYDLKNGQAVNQQGTFPPDFKPPTFQDFEDFFPDYFYNLDNILQETIPFIRPPPFIRYPPFSRPFYNPYFERTFDSVENQRLAFSAATKAFDLTTNRAFNQHFAPSRFPFGGNFPGFDGFPGAQGFPSRSGFQGQGFPGLDMSNNGNNENSAYAGAAIGPNYRHQMAAINPENPNNPNINTNSNVGGQPSGFKTVSSSTFVSSSDVNGKKTGSKQAETTINDNGVITKYKVQN